MPECMDSHNACMTESGEMIILCGYYSKSGEYSNKVWSYDI